MQRIAAIIEKEDMTPETLPDSIHKTLDAIAASAAKRAAELADLDAVVRERDELKHENERLRAILMATLID